MDLAKTVLLVEDNPADAQLTKMAFENSATDSRLQTFHNGKDLLSYLQTDSLQAVSLILLDLNMPNMNGRDLLKILQDNKHWRKIPVVVFSSSMQKEDVKDCYNLGAKAFLTKPFDLIEFEKTIEAIVNFWTRVHSPVQVFKEEFKA